MPDTARFLSLKLATAPKAGPRASGSVAYRVLRAADTDDLFFALVGNEGGSGYFSTEAVPFAKVAACLEGADPERPVPAKLFAEAFVGRSVNNAGFLCALLRAEGFLEGIPDAAHRHRKSGDVAAWKAAMLKLSGEPYDPPAGRGAKGNAAPPPPPPAPPAGRRGRRKGPSEAVDSPSGEPAHAQAE